MRETYLASKGGTTTLRESETYGTTDAKSVSYHKSNVWQRKGTCTRNSDCEFTNKVCKLAQNAEKDSRMSDSNLYQDTISDEGALLLKERSPKNQNPSSAYDNSRISIP